MSDQSLSAGGVRPSVLDMVANTTGAMDEIRREIDHQSKDVERIDTKATAVLTLTAAGATFVAVRIEPFDSDPRRWAAGITAIALAVLVFSLFHAIRPRDEFSYGPNPATMVGHADRLDRLTWLLWAADSFVASRELNRAFLKAKQNWYQRALRTGVATVLGISWMVYAGALS